MSGRGSGRRGGAGGGGICFDWANRGTCSRGAQCKFQHVGGGGSGGGQRGGRGGGASSVSQGRGGPGVGGGGGICHQWQATGTCQFGSGCRYRHIGPGGSGGGGVRTTPHHQSNEEDLVRFVKHLAAVPKDRIGAELFKSADIWRKCWQKHKLLDDKTIRTMLEVLAKTPGSSSVEPPQTDLLEPVIQKFLKTETSAQKGNDAVLTAIKTVVDALTRCLDFEWTGSTSQIRDTLSRVILSAESSLRKQVREHRHVSARLMDMLGDMEKPWRIKLAAQNDVTGVTGSAAGAEAALSYDQWKGATIKWLSTPDFFAPVRCPVMKVGAAGVYDSSDDYLDSVHRLWVAMTFFDGHAALAPHCRSRGNSGHSCGNALWPIPPENLTSESARSLRCRTRHCQNPVEYACRVNKAHDALCGDCAARSIENHRGEPGPHASTHVYDCQVKTVETGGIMYLKEFKSRNPPPNQIHWRTTKRLSPPNLVGVVRLPMKGSRLADTDKVIWAEIVYHNSSLSRFEDQRRQKGELAVNLATIVDFDPDYFQEGMSVAVIDCMCFVPEWVPVLRAIDMKRNSRLPFENGRHLNLWRDQPISSACSVLDDMSLEEVVSAQPRQLISDLVDTSNLEPIREIRRDSTLKLDLTNALEKLVIATTLDPMQLVSFVDALRNPVHLTQGPPGTGKSYFGVVLVRALILIRNMWLKKSRSTAASPILVLSYKNHAIDEFLVDIANAEPSLNGNKMIRIGGQSKDARLIQFSERTAYHADAEVKSSRTLVDNLQNLRESIQVTIEREVASFLAYRDQIFLGDDEKAKRKAAIQATTVLMKCIVRKLLIRKALAKSSEEDFSKSLDEHDADSVSTAAGGKTTVDLSFLSLQQNGETSKHIKNPVATADGSALIEALVQGRLHYGKEHWGELVLQWLTNKRPRPKCLFNNCTELSISPDVSLCSQHACSHINNLQGARCNKICIKDGFEFCSEHSCKVSECKQQKIGGKHAFCKEHACKRCVELDIVAKLAVDPPPSNVCDDHPLCMFFSCHNVCLDNSNYCDEHNTVKNCKALTRRGKPCKGTPVSRAIPYCKDHRHLFRTLDVDLLSADDAVSTPKAQIAAPSSKGAKRPIFRAFDAKTNAWLDLYFAMNTRKR